MALVLSPLNHPSHPVILLVRAEIVGGNIVITPEALNRPGARLPNNIGADGFGTSDLSFHTYSVVSFAPHTLRGPGGLAALERALIDDATPGTPRPATPGGTVNDVGKIPFVGSASNYVRSYVTESPRPGVVSRLVVNYTIKGRHVLEEGFVLRYIRLEPDGTLSVHSYGEGNAIEQNMALRFFWGPRVEETWQHNQRDIIAAALREVRGQ